MPNQWQIIHHIQFNVRWNINKYVTNVFEWPDIWILCKLKESSICPHLLNHEE